MSGNPHFSENTLLKNPPESPFVKRGIFKQEGRKVNAEKTVSYSDPFFEFEGKKEYG